MANDRIFYACQGVAIQNCGKPTGVYVTTGEMVHGLQSIGVNTNFNLEQVFELGQIAIYENIEGNPDVEVTMEKVIDGYPLIYHLATTGIGGGAGSLLNRSKQKCQVVLGIYPDTNNAIDDNGNPPISEVFMSGLYVSSLSYTFPVDGNCTESVTLVGNHKQWFASGNVAQRLNATSTNNFDNADEPLDNGIDRRQDVLMGECIFPQSIYGVIGTGVGNGSGNIHVQNVTISTDLGREDILELGRKMPYARPATFPVEVTCEIEVISTSGDWVNALEDGDPSLTGINAGNNTRNECILVKTRQGLQIDLGCKNRLQSVTYGGGDAGGGNATSTYSYVTYNTMDVTLT